MWWRRYGTLASFLWCLDAHSRPGSFSPPVSYVRTLTVIHRVGGQPIELYRAEGITFAHAAAGNERFLFADGRAWLVPTIDTGTAKRVCALLTGGPSPLPCADVRAMLLEAEGVADGGGAALGALLIELLDEGYLYALQLGPPEDEDDEKDV